VSQDAVEIYIPVAVILRVYRQFELYLPVKTGITQALGGRGRWINHSRAWKKRSLLHGQAGAILADIPCFMRLLKTGGIRKSGGNSGSEG